MAAESEPSHRADCDFLARAKKKAGLHMDWGESLACSIHRGAGEQLL